MNVKHTPEFQNYELHIVRTPKLARITETLKMCSAIPKLVEPTIAWNISKLSNTTLTRVRIHYFRFTL